METINHEYYVSLEVARLLKKAGFDWECDNIYYCYHEDNDTWDLESNNKNHLRILELDYCLLAPTLDVAQRWLREVKCIILLVWHDHRDKFGYSAESKVFDIDLSTEFTGDKETYEEALEAGVKKCLTLILEKDANH